MGCNCGKRGQVYVGGETLGYIVILPDGTQLPPNGEVYFSVLEAKAEVRRAGGGTIKRMLKSAS
jgi:hypothetical protein